MKKLEKFRNQKIKQTKQKSEGSLTNRLDQVGQRLSSLKGRGIGSFIQKKMSKQNKGQQQQQTNKPTRRKDAGTVELYIRKPHP